MANERWRPVAGFEGLWETVVAMRGGSWPLRSVAIELAGGELAVHSAPAKVDDGLWDELDNIGRTTIAFAPNHYHNLGIPKLLARYPDALVVASDVARPRLEKKLASSMRGRAVLGLDELRTRLRPGSELLELPGTRNGEVWLALDGTREGADGERAWVVCDAFFNVAHHPPGMFGLFCRLTRTTGGLCLGRTWTTLALRDKRAYREWLIEKLERAPPTALLVSHGDIARGADVAAALTLLVDAHL